MTLVAGVDSSTQATKILVCDAATGHVVRAASADHPAGTEVDPDAWWDALERASAEGLLADVSAVGVAAQQHGMTPLDAAGEAVRPALLWNDTRSAGAAQDLVDELGGPDGWVSAVGSVPLASFTVTKLRWMAETEPQHAAATRAVSLPHDWLTWRLRGGGPGTDPAEQVELVTDRGDASGTGYWSPAAGAYRRDLLERAFGRCPEMPRVAAPGEAIGVTATGAGSPVPDGLVVSSGTGDNMGAALGLGIGPGDVVVSLGTSGTVFGVHEHAVADASGAVAGFADATGRFLPLVCTLNAARVLTGTAQLLGVETEELSELALRAEPGAGGLTLLPYLDGERTPNLPDACGTLTGLRRDAMTPQNVARASIEGMLCGLADGLDALRSVGLAPRRVLLIGGAARSAAVRAVAPMVFGVSVTVPTPAEYVALGAARQATWALQGTAEPPEWSADPAALGAQEQPLTAADEHSGHRVRAQYAAVREQVHTSRGATTGM